MYAHAQQLGHVYIVSTLDVSILQGTKTTHGMQTQHTIMSHANFFIL